MNAISDILKELQGEGGLRLNPDFIFPVGLSNDVENYWDDKRKRHKMQLKKDVNEPEGDWLFQKFRRTLARRYLAYVVFFAAIAIAILAVLDIVLYHMCILYHICILNQPESTWH